jgi:regulator of replication initiation timing
VLLLQARIADLEQQVRTERQRNTQLVAENARLHVENRRLQTDNDWLEQLNDNIPLIMEHARQIAALAPR